MNAQNAKDFLPLVQALSEGKTIQGKSDDGRWFDLKSPSFQSPPEHHRIKPEPRVIYVNDYVSGLGYAHLDEASAKKAQRVDGVPIHRFIEDTSYTPSK